MALLRISFRWWKDPTGYRLAPAEPDDPSKWLISGIGRPERVIPNSANSRLHYPLDEHDRLYVEFSNLGKAQDVLNFVRENGPITEFGLRSGCKNGFHKLLNTPNGFANSSA